MKATGIVRRIDDLGRIVIPKEIRRTMREEKEQHCLTQEIDFTSDRDEHTKSNNQHQIRRLIVAFVLRNALRRFGLILQPFCCIIKSE